MEKFRELVNCRMCNSSDYKTVYEWPKSYYDHNIYETASWDGRQNINLIICKCEECGLVFSNPSFKVEYLGLVYPDDLVPEVNDIRDKDAFIEALDLEKHQEMYNLIKDKIKKNSKILDVGTRYGGLPYLLRLKGYDAYGIEYNTSSVDLANSFGLEYIHPGTISDLPSFVEKRIPDERINCVVMDDVLEHLVNPFEDLRQVSECQKEGDMVVLRQMNWKSMGHKIFNKQWYYLQPAAHMSYFTPQTAKKLLQKCGYKRTVINKTNILYNLLRTAVRILRGSNTWRINDKTMYLSERKKSYDDMFTIIGFK